VVPTGNVEEQIAFATLDTLVPLAPLPAHSTARTKECVPFVEIATSASATRAKLVSSANIKRALATAADMELVTARQIDAFVLLGGWDSTALCQYAMEDQLVPRDFAAATDIAKTREFASAQRDGRARSATNLHVSTLLQPRSLLS